MEGNNYQPIKWMAKNDRCGSWITMNAACQYGHTHVVDVLLRDGRFDPSDTNVIGTALTTAINNNRLEVVQRLLEDSRTRIDYKDTIAAFPYTNILELLLQDKRTNIQNYDITILSVAMEKKLDDVALVLVQNMQIWDYINIVPILWNTVKFGLIHTAEYMIKNGVDITVDDYEVFFIAVEYARLPIIKLLLQDSRVRAVAEREGYTINMWE